MFVSKKDTVQIFENTLTMGPMNIQDFLYPEYDSDLCQNLITSFFGQVLNS